MYQSRAFSGVGTAGPVCYHQRLPVQNVQPLKRLTLPCGPHQSRCNRPIRPTQGKASTQHGSSAFRDKQNAQEKAQAASQGASERVKQTYKAVEGGVKQAARRVNTRFDLAGKAQQTRDRVVQQLEEIDDRLQLRQKARTTLADAQRQLPHWRRQYNAFSKTLPGKVLWFAFLIWGFRSGLFFKLLSLTGLLFLLAPLVLVPYAQNMVKRAAAVQAQQQQQAQQAQQARNPFSQFTGFGNMRQQQQQRQQQQSGGMSSRQPQASSYTQQAGPVIDAEWTSIDED